MLGQERLNPQASFEAPLSSPSPHSCGLFFFLAELNRNAVLASRIFSFPPRLFFLRITCWTTSCRADYSAVCAVDGVSSVFLRISSERCTVSFAQSARPRVCLPLHLRTEGCIAHGACLLSAGGTVGRAHLRAGTSGAAGWLRETRYCRRFLSDICAVFCEYLSQIWTLSIFVRPTLTRLYIKRGRTRWP